NPKRVIAAALFFGGAEALQFALQSEDADLPYPLFLALPYVLSLAALAGWFGRSQAPEALGSAWPGRHPG
ncbi:MAG: ABC transporter permease, partial [Gemmatimonadota bacterium]|nr:ABC transporter permease [Gemmatimonadota bacterium]